MRSSPTVVSREALSLPAAVAATPRQRPNAVRKEGALKRSGRHAALHSFIAHFIEADRDVHTNPALTDHHDINPTIIHRHALKKVHVSGDLPMSSEPTYNIAVIQENEK